MKTKTNCEEYGHGFFTVVTAEHNEIDAESNKTETRYDMVMICNKCGETRPVKVE